MSDLENWLKSIQDRKNRRVERVAWTRRFVKAQNRADESRVIEELRMEAHRRSPYKIEHT